MPTSSTARSSQLRAKSVNRRPFWNSYLTDFERATKEELQQRKQRHTSSNSESAKKELTKKLVQQKLQKRGGGGSASSGRVGSTSKAIRREVLTDVSTGIHDSLMYSDEQMSALQPHISGPVCYRNASVSLNTPEPTASFKPMASTSSVCYDKDATFSCLNDLDQLNDDDSSEKENRQEVEDEIVIRSGPALMPAAAKISTPNRLSSRVYDMSEEVASNRRTSSVTEMLSNMVDRINEYNMTQNRVDSLAISSAGGGYTTALIESVMFLVDELEAQRRRHQESVSTDAQLRENTQIRAEIESLRNDFEGFKQHIMQQLNVLRTEIMAELQSISTLFAQEEMVSGAPEVKRQLSSAKKSTKSPAFFADADSIRLTEDQPVSLAAVTAIQPLSVHEFMRNVKSTPQKKSPRDRRVEQANVLREPIDVDVSSADADDEELRRKIEQLSCAHDAAVEKLKFLNTSNN